MCICVPVIMARESGEQNFYTFIAYYKLLPTIFHERIWLHKFCKYRFLVNVPNECTM